MVAHRGLATGVGEIREVALPDGSRMVLNSTSRVEVAYTPERRLLVLAREAFFDVAHNPQRPFDVQVGATCARWAPPSTCANAGRWWN
jgi:transmembrane sensor